MPGSTCRHRRENAVARFAQFQSLASGKLLEIDIPAIDRRDDNLSSRAVPEVSIRTAISDLLVPAFAFLGLRVDDLRGFLGGLRRGGRLGGVSSSW
jgi:hypothetical protein